MEGGSERRNTRTVYNIPSICDKQSNSGVVGKRGVEFWVVFDEYQQLLFMLRAHVSVVSVRKRCGALESLRC